MNEALPELIVFDFDGVLTDNRVYVAQDGTEIVACHRGDGLAFDAFRRIGLRTAILSTEANPVVAARARKLETPVVQATSDKVAAVKALARDQGIGMDRVLFVGNDVNDLAAMRACGQSACPSDSHPRIREAATFVLENAGGAGVARELAEAVLGIDVEAVLYPQDR